MDMKTTWWGRVACFALAVDTVMVGQLPHWLIVGFGLLACFALGMLGASAADARKGLSKDGALAELRSAWFRADTSTAPVPGAQATVSPPPSPCSSALQQSFPTNQQSKGDTQS